ncbi:hypothetical protein C8Q79DRAFT_631077 [Trametes meyenii]|nr:hypothetical protein C8Q79DRAFT_631077 [Trametes meyenii]
MDKLAVELLNQIFLHACTDGGQTGCALALVSKRIRTISRPARFHSIALYSSPDKIELFLRTYQQERARAVDMLPRVRHLWLSYDENGRGGFEVPEPSSSANPPSSRAEFLALLQRRAQRWCSAQENLDEQYKRVIPALINVVAPDLYTLALNQSRWRGTSVVKCRFPRLQELTLVGGDPSFLPFSAAEDDVILYPSLRRLHHILTPICKDVNFVNWAQHAPRLTHLRVSRLDFCPRTTSETLEQVISDSDSDEFFPHLQKVIILPHPPPPPGSAALSQSHYLIFMQNLHELPQRAKVPVELLPHHLVPMHEGVASPRECVLRLRGLWKERIEGGPGCWAQGLVAGPPPARESCL